MKGKLILLLGPSGVGKGTVINMLKVRHPEFVYPLSVTTREKRREEKEGEVYHFVSPREFDEHLQNNELLEWAVVHQKQRYGVLKRDVIRALQDGKMVIREVDVQGWQKILKTEVAPAVISIFLEPPSIASMRKRILARAPISEQELELRLQDIAMEIKAGKDCTYHIVSEDNQQEKVYGEIENIILNAMKE